jgi:hypothetical protein
MPVQLNHADKRRGELLDHTRTTGKRVVQRKVRGLKTHGAIAANDYLLV